MMKAVVKWVVTGSFLLIVVWFPHSVLGETTDSLYTEIDGNGTVIDGSLADIPHDKPVIRPTYVGKAIKEDVSGPDGPFLGFYGEKPNVGSGDSYYGHEYRIGTNTIMRNLGTFKGKEIALRMDFTRATPSWTAKVNLESDGAVRFAMDYESPAEVRLVYNDGDYRTPVENVYVELPLLYRPTAYNPMKGTYDTSYVRTSNLKRVYFTTLSYNNIINRVSREVHTFIDTSAKSYEAEALKMVHDNSKSTSPLGENVGMTFFFDNNQPLVFYGKGVTSPASYATFFKSSLKTPGEIKYLAPKTKSVKNTDKFEAHFDLTQGLNDGYTQYFPDYLSVVMSDRKGKFKRLRVDSAIFTDQGGEDISHLIELVPINDHEVEFRVKREDLIALGSNQLNLTFSAEGLDSQAVMKDFDEVEGVYPVPVTFYNYKWQNNQKIKSEELVAVANIIPNIYGEAMTGIKASQYTMSGDLDVERLLKNVATTLPGDELAIAMVDPTITFDEVKTYQVEVSITSKSTQRVKVVSVPIAIDEAVIVTRAFFEDQEWLIKEVNRQLAPKTIDSDVYMSDLLKIKSIVDRDTEAKFAGQHIPKTISELKNLESLELWNKEMTGKLPEELGELSHLKHLIIYGNKFKGSIPESLGNLKELSILYLYFNSLSGAIPQGLGNLKKLREINVSFNQLIGSIPVFPDGQLTKYDVSYSQVTFNDHRTPTFIPRVDEYGRTLIVKNHSNTGKPYVEWHLNGHEKLPVVVDQTVIKPFDPANRGFFNLHVKATSDESKLALFPDHRYQIISQKTGEVVYEGLANKSVEVVADVGESFEIIMDDAPNNPNNCFVIKGTPRELTIMGTPKTLSLTLKTDSLAMEPVGLSGNDRLRIRDNRLGGNWQLKVKPTELSSEAHILKGSYLYTNQANQLIELPVGIYKGIEEGKSNASTEFIDVISGWESGRGLRYQSFQMGNYKGNYQGKLDWQLVDAPGIEDK
ncbi:hypothetical protein [uncultured Vagococcus sp.]|uniref:leucine-rich repeat domain-containing protein n=1 Tax=uncultured Vagococcus sp. TaxID=189676 RepID=UPI0028D4E850|nr:hypothetical protein [uncultured Vagococcus sp.]